MRSVWRGKTNVVSFPFRLNVIEEDIEHEHKNSHKQEDFVVHSVVDCLYIRWHFFSLVFYQYHTTSWNNIDRGIMSAFSGCERECECMFAGIFILIYYINNRMIVLRIYVRSCLPPCFNTHFLLRQIPFNMTYRTRVGVCKTPYYLNAINEWQSFPAQKTYWLFCTWVKLCTYHTFSRSDYINPSGTFPKNTSHYFRDWSAFFILLDWVQNLFSPKISNNHFTFLVRKF